MNRGENIWTPELDGRLRSLWDRGLSTAQIGRELGLTKNQVVGRAHRIELPKRPGITHRRTGYTPNDPRPHALAANPGRLGGCVFIAGDPTEEVRAGNDPFCGAERRQGSSYCATHHAICYTGKPRHDRQKDGHRFPRDMAEGGYGKGRVPA